jgi:hypothetical protein
MDVAAAALLQGRELSVFERVPCNICGDAMTLDTWRRRRLADGAGWDGAVCADCNPIADHLANADRYRR